MSSPNLKGAARNRPSFNKPKSPATPRTESAGERYSGLKTTKDGMPILFGGNEAVHGAVSFSQWLRELHPHLRKLYPRVADQVVTRVRDAPLEPPEPVPIRPLSPGADEARKAEYSLELALYMDDRKARREEMPRYLKLTEELVNQEKQVIATIWGVISPGLQQRIEESFEDLSTSNDVVKLVTLAERHSQSQRSQNERGLRLSAEKALYTMAMTSGESLLSYHRRFTDAGQLVADRGGRDLSPPSYARLYVSGLDRRWAPMVIEMANKEAEVEVRGIGEDPYPQDVSTAYALAAARVTTKAPKSEEDQRASTINQAIGKGADSEGKGGGTRGDKKNRAGKPDKDREKGPKGDCHTCGGELNSAAGGSHYAKDCPIALMDPIEKEKLINKLKAVEKPRGGAATAKSIVVRHTEDSDDEGHASYASIMGIARPIILSTCRRRFRVFDFQLDHGANVIVIAHEELLFNIRRNPSHGVDVIDTAGGAVSFEFIGDSPLFGVCYYDPKGTVNILPYAFACRNFEVHGYRPNPKQPEKYYDITFDEGSARFFLTRDDIYVGNLEHIFKEKRRLANSAVIVSMSEKQRRVAEGIRNDSHLRGFESLTKLLTSMRKGYIKNAPFTTDDVRRAISLGPNDSAAEVAVRHGKHVNRPVHGLKLGDQLGDRELVLHGDLLFFYSVPFLLMVSEPGSYAAVQHVTQGRKTNSLFSEVKEIVNWFSSFNWRVKIISFDGEGGISAATDGIRSLGIEVVIYPTNTCDPIAEVKIKHIKERARSIVSYIKLKHGWKMFSKLVPWLGVASAARTNSSPTSANPDDMPPVTFITGMEIDFRRHCAAGFGDYLEVKSPITAAAPSNSMEPRTQSAIALMPDLRGHWWMFLLASLRTVKRDVTHSDVMPTSTAVQQRIQDLCIQYPLRGGDLDDIGNIDEDPISEIIVDSSAHTVRAEDSGVEAMVATPEIVPSENVISNEVVVEAEDSEGPGSEGPPDQNDDVVDDDANASNVPDVAPETASVEPSEEPIATKVQWKRRTMTRGLDKVTRSGHIYSTRKRSVLFSTAGVLSLKKGLEQYGEEARKALIAEIDSMIKRKVWTGVLRDNLSKRQRKAIIRSHTFLKEKLSPSNVFLRLKARLVAMGNMQDRALYEKEDTSSPTVAQSSAYVVLAVAANERRHVMSFDVGSAYLHADMPGEVVMELDPITTAILTQLDPTFLPFVGDDGKLLVRLNKALYGCVESAKAWYRHLKRCLEKLGYVTNEYDPCVFNRWTESGFQSTVFFHVDDGIATCEDELELDKLEGELRAEFGEMNVTRGKRHEFLGLVLDFSKDGVVAITAPRLIGEILEDFGISGTSRVPASVDLFEIDIDSPLLSEAQRRKFHGGVQKLLYIAGKCRMDISVPVNFLTTRVTIATEQDMKKLTKTLRYLNGTRDLGLMLGGDEQGFISVQIFADASYGVHVDGKSHSGVAVTLGRGAILIHSGKQRLVVKSSAEAELVTQADSLGYGFRILNFIKAQGYDIDQGIIHQDNQAAIRLAENGRSTSNRTRHIKIRYFFLKQFLDSGELQVVYCPTDKMVADILTKPLQGEIFAKGRSYLLGYDSP